MNENQNNQGAPSSDETSALFVSARKKQLAEQEEQRLAAEKQAARLAAEEEVRRLEAEVAERKRKAEADAVQIQQEEEERRRQAEIEKARIASELKSAANTQYAPPTNNAPPPPYGQVATGSTVAVKPAANMVNDLLADKKKLAIVAGAAVGALVVIILLASLFSGGAKPRFTHTMDSNVYIDLNEDGTAEGVSPEMLEFSGYWYYEGGEVVIESDTYSAYLGVIDENTIYDYNYEGEFVFNAN